LAVLWLHIDLVGGNACVDHISHLQHTQTTVRMIIFSDYFDITDLVSVIVMIFAVIRRWNHCVMMVLAVVVS
jgi:hypothetical protein